MSWSLIILGLSGALWASLAVGALNDPMAPPRHTPAALAARSAPSAFKPEVLQWTMWGSAGAFAWYGGRVVQPGDRVERGVVVGIAEDHIVVEHRGQRHKVFVLSEAARPSDTTPSALPSLPIDGGNHANRP